MVDARPVHDLARMTCSGCGGNGGYTVRQGFGTAPSCSCHLRPLPNLLNFGTRSCGFFKNVKKPASDNIKQIHSDADLYRVYALLLTSIQTALEISSNKDGQTPPHSTVPNQSHSLPQCHKAVTNVLKANK